MNSSCLKVILYILICISLTAGEKTFAQSTWPSESILTVRDLSHGPLCQQCTTHLSQSYCTPTCCNSCNSEATNRGLNLTLACGNICGLSQTPAPTRADRAFIEDCENSSYSSAQCAEIEPIVNRSITTDRAFERRVQSCNQAIAATNRYCSRAHLNSVYPADLFRMAQDISNSSTCDLNEVEQYNLRSDTGTPQEELELCEKNYDDCKAYCFDQNVVDGVSSGRHSSLLINREGHRKYENECKPNRARFISEKQIREDVLAQASETALTCQDTGRIPRDDDETSGADTVDTKGPLAKALETPQAAYQNLSSIRSAIEPFLSHNELGSSRPPQLAGQVIPESARYGLTDQEMYGPEYQGNEVSDADDLDFASPEFDQPQALRPTAPGNNGNYRNFGALGGAGGGGMMGQGGPRGGNSAGRPRRGRPGRKLQKDKTLFGKQEQGVGGSYSMGSTSGSRSARRNQYSSGSTQQGAAGEKPRVFNASKYHDLILASYNKGINSQAQKSAMRKAAGYDGREQSELRAKGYTSWHLENKIHPESISIFTQTRICYDTKYSLGFQQTCAFSK